MGSYDINDNDELLRRVPKVLSHFNNEGITSAAFKPKTGEDGLSVDILSLTTIENSIKDPNKFLAAIITVENVIQEGCKCIHDPITDNYAHALIKGVTRQIARKFSKISIVKDLAK